MCENPLPHLSIEENPLPHLNIEESPLPHLNIEESPLPHLRLRRACGFFSTWVASLKISTLPEFPLPMHLIYLEQMIFWNYDFRVMISDVVFVFKYWVSVWVCLCGGGGWGGVCERVCVHSRVMVEELSDLSVCTVCYGEWCCIVLSYTTNSLAQYATWQDSSAAYLAKTFLHSPTNPLQVQQYYFDLYLFLISEWHQFPALGVTQFHRFYTSRMSGAYLRYTRFFKRTKKFRLRLGLLNISPIWATMFLILFLNCS